MSLIKPRTRGKAFVRHWTKLDRETNETLHAYAAFIEETTEYVINQVIDTVLAKDKEFLQWRALHPQSYVPEDAGSGQSSNGKNRRLDQLQVAAAGPRPEPR